MSESKMAENIDWLIRNAIRTSNYLIRKDSVQRQCNRGRTEILSFKSNSRILNSKAVQSADLDSVSAFTV